MPAATAAIDTPERSGEKISIGVAAATTLYAGTLIATNAAGHAVSGAATAGLSIQGRAEEDKDNSAGSAGDVSIIVKRGVFRFTNSGTAPLSIADRGKLAFVEDNQTVAKTATLKIPAGRVVDVDDDGVWVDTTAAAFQHVRNTLIATAGTTLTEAQSGLVISNAGASGAVTHVLPAATPGLEFIAIVEAAQELRLDPAGTETIALPSSGVQGAAGKYLTADAVGEKVHLLCLTAGTWDVVHYSGTWTAEA